MIDDDVYRMEGIKRDTQKMRLLLRSLARNESTTASNKTLMKDIKAVDRLQHRGGLSGHLQTAVYHGEPASLLLRYSFFCPHQTGGKTAFCRPVPGQPRRTAGDLEALGFLFEALCERNLRIYAESFGANLCHYQDYKNQEIDAVIELPDGQWCAFEIKLGANQIDIAAANLLEIKNRFQKTPRANHLLFYASCATWPTRPISAWTGCLWCRRRR